MPMQPAANHTVANNARPIRHTERAQPLVVGTVNMGPLSVQGPLVEFFFFFAYVLIDECKKRKQILVANARHRPTPHARGAALPCP